MSALSDLLNRYIADKYGDVSNRELARKSDGALSRATIDNYRRGNHGTPTAEILLAFHNLTSAPMADMRRAAGIPTGERTPWQPPPEADLMSRRQRRAVTDLIRSMVLPDEEARRTELAEYLRSTPEHKDIELSVAEFSRIADSASRLHDEIAKEGRSEDAFLTEEIRRVATAAAEESLRRITGYYDTGVGADPYRPAPAGESDECRPDKSPRLPHDPEPSSLTERYRRWRGRIEPEPEVDHRDEGAK
ncbi:hypothetical protein [Mycobacterium canetti]|uniref:hypothetical protein n=1 Tax=Mycobacterium canetti TaxID=78331 RepID=UPI001E383A37|nr:hypothetical protein [Mycobacterium canetti]